MMFKKIIPLGAVLVLSSLPLIAEAAFTAKNYTNEDSSVRVTAKGTSKRCSMEAGVYTPKQTPAGPGESNIVDPMINILCANSATTSCTADIFNGRNCEADGQKVGTASLDTRTKKVTSVESVDTRYVFKNHGGTLLEIRYANAGK